MTDPAQLADLAINQPDVALIFEGGGMRNSYTAPMVCLLYTSTFCSGVADSATMPPWIAKCSRAILHLPARRRCV